MSTSLKSLSSSVQDVESWNDKILSFQMDEVDPAAFDRQIEQSLSAIFDPEQAFGDLGSSCEALYCTSYWPVQ